MGKKRIIAGLDLYEDENEINNEKINSVRDFKDIKFVDMTIGDIIKIVMQNYIKMKIEIDHAGGVIILEPPDVNIDLQKKEEEEFDLDPIVRNSSRKTNLSNLWK